MGFIHAGHGTIWTPGPPNASVASKVLVLPTLTNSHEWQPTSGAWTEIFAASAVKHPVHAIRVTAVGLHSSVPMARMIQLGFGASSSETQLIALPFREKCYKTQTHQTILIPISLPAGTRISCRHRMSVTGSGGGFSVAVDLLHHPLPHLDSYHTVEYGGFTIDSTHTNGQSFTFNASANTYATSYQQISAEGASGVLKHPAKAFLLFFDCNNNNPTEEAHRIKVATGAAASEVDIYELTAYGIDGTNSIDPTVHGPLLCNLPAGTRISVNAMSSRASCPTRQFYMIFFG